jgi:hypothetical protein
MELNLSPSPELTFTTEETERHISALQDSVNLINKLLSDGVKTSETLDIMDRNARHIHIMCEKKHIKEFNVDLLPYLDKANEGLEWISGA